MKRRHMILLWVLLAVLSLTSCVPSPASTMAAATHPSVTTQAIATTTSATVAPTTAMNLTTTSLAAEENSPAAGMQRLYLGMGLYHIDLPQEVGDFSHIGSDGFSTECYVSDKDASCRVYTNYSTMDQYEEEAKTNFNNTIQWVFGLYQSEPSQKLDRHEAAKVMLANGQQVEYVVESIGDNAYCYFDVLGEEMGYNLYIILRQNITILWGKLWEAFVSTSRGSRIMYNIMPKRRPRACLPHGTTASKSNSIPSGPYSPII